MWPLCYIRLQPIDSPLFLSNTDANHNAFHVHTLPSMTHYHQHYQHHVATIAAVAAGFRTLPASYVVTDRRCPQDKSSGNRNSNAFRDNRSHHYYQQRQHYADAASYAFVSCIMSSSFISLGCEETCHLLVYHRITALNLCSA